MGSSFAYVATPSFFYSKSFGPRKSIDFDIVTVFLLKFDFSRNLLPNLRFWVRSELQVA